MTFFRSTNMRTFLSIILALGALTLAGCGGYGVHKIDIQQGNLVTKEQFDRITPGMTRADVRNTLGTPLVQDVFNGNRWDYYFSDDRSTKFGPFGRDKQQYKVAVFFDGDRVAKIDGTPSPVEILTGGGDRRALPNTVPPGAPTPPPKQ
jgi:outer membrane protein assembly factor BamE